jgi:hypothetical protein
MRAKDTRRVIDVYLHGFGTRAQSPELKLNSSTPARKDDSPNADTDLNFSTLYSLCNTALFALGPRFADCPHRNRDYLWTTVEA